ncbi:MAG: hypothetical protein IGQ45_11735 [Cyanobacterium sp. T60_A2020_053]|nr:hypothetical protein [Cyanobacterium sp. T60_A2020_053]
MSSLPITTKKRLQRIPQLSNVWEGNMFPVEEMMENIDPDLAETAQCILWIDASEGIVRSMDVIRKDTGFEAMVRALLKAIENPHSPGEPCRPQKVVVKDRELQFFLRGALQDLAITVDYQPDLPLLDEIWRNFKLFQQDSSINIPVAWMQELEKEAINLIWDQEIWNLIAEYDIIEIQLNTHDVESLYACVMGMMGKEFGVIFYRSLDSMKQFRSLAVDLDDEASEAELERSFLQQDCWFLNFSHDEDDDKKGNLFDLFSKDDDEVEALFGSIHPYEGIRPISEQEEAIPVYLAVRALGLFFAQFEKELEKEPLDLLTTTFKLTLPWDKNESFSVQVNTMPELAVELEEMGDDDDDDDVVLKTNLIPSGSMFNFGFVPILALPIIDDKRGSHLDLTDILDFAPDSNIPTFMVQNTRGKIKEIIDVLAEDDGIESLCFALGNHDGEKVCLVVIQTYEDEYYLLSEINCDARFMKALNKWQEKVEEFDGCCAVAFAMGVTGASKGNPEMKDILGFFETTMISVEDAGLEDLFDSI